MESFQMIAKTFQGLEEVLAQELTALGANDIEIGRRMVSFSGDKEMILQRYTGSTPFLLSGGINSYSVKALKEFHHPRLAGIDINSRFETSPGIKDVERIERFLKELRTN